jgi:glutamyl-tRNA reductase
MAERERFAVEVHRAIGDAALVLETCHRVEAYVVSAAVGTEALAAIAVPTGGRELRGEDAVRHAISLAVGRDSVVVGEDQVLHQLRSSVTSARAAGRLDPVLERLFATALRSGRLARSWRSGPERSLATVAVSEIERRSGSLAGRPVLIVGAGRMGRLASRATRAAGAIVRIANRSSAAAAFLAEEVGGEAVPFDPGERVHEVAAVIVALSGPWTIAASTRNAFGPGTIVVDLSVPGAVDADLRDRLGSRLITADDLARLAAETLAPDPGAARRLDALIDEATADVLGWLDRHAGRAAAAALAERADAARRAELDVLWHRLPDLDPDARAAIETMTRHFSDRLLREPLERLGHDRDGEAERAVREAFAL